MSGMWNVETDDGITWSDGNIWPKTACNEVVLPQLRREMDMTLVDKEKCDWII